MLEKSAPKWNALAKRDFASNEIEPFFKLKSGKPTPVLGEQDPNFLSFGLSRNQVQLRKLSKSFPKSSIASLLLQIRALIGTNSRSEILLYLLLNGQGSIQDIAAGTGYAWRSVQDSLFEMGHSPVIHFPQMKRSRKYFINA